MPERPCHAVLGLKMAHFVLNYDVCICVSMLRHTNTATDTLYPTVLQTFIPICVGVSMKNAKTLL